MKRVICLALIPLAACSCDESVTDGQENDSTTVLLHSGFSRVVSGSQWEVTVSEFGSYRITGDGMLFLESGVVPGALGDHAVLVSKGSWPVGDGQSYLLSVDAHLCGTDGGQFIGFVCNGGGIWSDRLGLEIWGSDHGQTLVLLNRDARCSVIFPQGDLHPLCLSLHRYSLKLTSSSVAFFIDGEPLGRLETSQECPLLVDSFSIMCATGGFYYGSSLAIDEVMLEKYR